MDSKLLSIAIPTYNRSVLLKEELDNILPQLVPFHDIVEICISDNASADSEVTKEFVDRYSRSYNIDIIYSRLDKGIYFEDNFDRAVGLTQGKYIQLMGDDDIFSPDFYQILMPLLSKNYDLIHFNRLVCNGKCSNGVLYDKLYDRLTLDLNIIDFIKRVKTGPDFMSSLIFSRRCWDEGESLVKESYYGYRFLGRLYMSALKLNNRAYYYYNPMIFMRNPEKRAWQRSYPLFLFVGLANIMKDADEFVKGLFDEWSPSLSSRINTIQLSEVYRAKEFYRDHKNEMLTFLTAKQRRIFHFMISPYTPAWLCALYNRLFTRFY